MELFTVRTSIDRATRRTLAGYVRPQRRTVLFGGLLVLLGGLAAATQPLAAKALVDRLGTGNAITGVAGAAGRPRACGTARTCRKSCAA